MRTCLSIKYLTIILYCIQFIACNSAGRALDNLGKVVGPTVNKAWVTKKRSPSQPSTTTASTDSSPIRKKRSRTRTQTSPPIVEAPVVEAPVVETEVDEEDDNEVSGADRPEGL